MTSSKRFLVEFQNGFNVKHAGSKAPSDMSEILCGNGFEQIYIRTCGGSKIGKLKELVSAVMTVLFCMKRKSLVVVQYPVYSKTGALVFKVLFSLMKLKSIVLVSLIHDVQYARFADCDKDSEIKLLNRFDYLIVHSKQMEQSLLSAGCRTKCIILGLFDYLVKEPSSHIPSLSYEITFAGNLKNEFLSHLSSLDDRLSFCIFGEPRIMDIESDNVKYCGSFTPDNLSSLCGSWGLVWDGPSVDCNTGTAGMYQRINSPHKASMYIVTGIPIIASSDAAIASIIKENKLGILVNSLHELYSEISKISEKEYREILDNVRAYSNRLRAGHNILSALSQLS